MTEEKKIAVLIPSLSPDEKLIQAVREIKDAGFDRILLVNDGSAEEYDSFFEAAKELGATVLRHDVNRGKGCALKTGFRYILEEWKDCDGVITADSDGQHRPADLLKCRDALRNHRDALVLGCRDFRDKEIPLRSRFGNRCTSFIMKLFVGVSLSDTQTGLRAFSTERMREYLGVAGDRFEYETNVLLYSKEEEIPMVEVPIETIYLEENKSSHFRPLVDSVKIYRLFLRYLFASLSSFLVDIALFSCGVFFLRELSPAYYIVISTVGARVLSSVYNFCVNRKGVFKSKENWVKTAVKYYILAIIQMLVSAIGVWGLCEVLPVHETVVKILVDGILFVISFLVQREWVFCGKKQTV